jgi:hypothetical protein
MIGLLKKLFGVKPAEQTADAPYKVEAAPVVDTADIALAQMPNGAAAIVEAPKAEAPKAEPKKKAAPAKKAAPKKPATAKKPPAPKKPKAKPTA